MREPAQRDRVVLAAHPIRWASASRRCSTGNASTPFTITTACSSDTLPAAIAVRTGSWSWSRACASSRRRFASRLVCRVGFAQWLLVSAAPAAAPRSSRSAWRAWRSSSSVIWCRNCGQGGQVGLGLGRPQGPQPEVGDLVQQLGDGGDRGRHRVLSGVVECRCHTGNSGIRPPTLPVPEPGFCPACGQSFSAVSGDLDVVVSTLARWRSLLDQREPVDTRSLALAARPAGTPSTLARWRSLLDLRRAQPNASRSNEIRSSTLSSTAALSTDRSLRGPVPASSSSSASRTCSVPT